MPQLQFTLSAGRNLPVKGKTTSDSYVKFRWRGDKYKTKVVDKDLNPIWNDTFTLDVSAAECQSAAIMLEVWNHNSWKRNQFMGRSRLSLDQLEQGQIVTSWHPLEGGTQPACCGLLITYAHRYTVSAQSTVSILAAFCAQPKAASCRRTPHYTEQITDPNPTPCCSAHQPMLSAAAVEMFALQTDQVARYLLACSPSTSPLPILSRSFSRLA